MNQRSSPPPPMSAALRAAARASGQPVRPLLAPAVRAAIVAAIGIGIAAAYVTIVGLRGDAAQLGPATVWLPAVLRLAAGAWLVLLALKEASPSEGATPNARAAGLIALPVLLVVSAVLLDAVRPTTGMGPLACYAKIVALAIPAAVLVTRLLARGYALRPLFAAVAGALGVSVLAEAALHLTCPATSLEHTLLIHGGAVASITFVAMALGLRAARRRTP